MHPKRKRRLGLLLMACGAVLMTSLIFLLPRMWEDGFASASIIGPLVVGPGIMLYIGGLFLFLAGRRASRSQT